MQGIQGFVEYYFSKPSGIRSSTDKISHFQAIDKVLSIRGASISTQPGDQTRFIMIYLTAKRATGWRLVSICWWEVLLTLIKMFPLDHSDPTLKLALRQMLFVLANQWIFSTGLIVCCGNTVEERITFWYVSEVDTSCLRWINRTPISDHCLCAIGSVWLEYRQGGTTSWSARAATLHCQQWKLALVQLVRLGCDLTLHQRHSLLNIGEVC